MEWRTWAVAEMAATAVVIRAAAEAASAVPVAKAAETIRLLEGHRSL